MVCTGDSSTSPPSSILKQPSNGAAKANGARVTFADDVVSFTIWKLLSGSGCGLLNPGSQDARRNSSSSLDGASSRLAQLHAHFTSAPGPSAQVVYLGRRFLLLKILSIFDTATFSKGSVVGNVALFRTRCSTASRASSRRTTWSRC